MCMLVLWHLHMYFLTAVYGVACCKPVKFLTITSTHAGGGLSGPAGIHNNDNELSNK